MKKKFVLLMAIFLLTLSPVYSATNTEALLQYNHGIDYFNDGQYDEAIGAFRTAIKLDPDYIDAYYNLGSVLEYMQQYDAALTVFKQIIVRKPEDYDSVYKAAWLSYKLGDSQKARTYVSLIPSYSSKYDEAKKLLTEMQAVPILPREKQTEQAASSKVPASNETFENLPAPTGITSDKKGNVYIAEFNTNTIIKITPDNKKLVFLKNPKLAGPIGLATDSYQNLYIANYNSNNILKVSPYGEATVLLSNVKKPYCLYVVDNILFVSCQGTNSVLKYKLPAE